MRFEHDRRMSARNGMDADLTGGACPDRQGIAVVTLPLMDAEEVDPATVWRDPVIMHRAKAGCVCLLETAGQPARVAGKRVLGASLKRLKELGNHLCCIGKAVLQRHLHAGFC